MQDLPTSHENYTRKKSNGQYKFPPTKIPECCIQYTSWHVMIQEKQSFSHSAIHYRYANSINTTFSAELQILIIYQHISSDYPLLTVLSHLPFFICLINNSILLITFFVNLMQILVQFII